jgi:hypothetical protein
MAEQRSAKAGQDLAKVIIEMVHLMYQNNTAKKFYLGLSDELNKEIRRRGLDANDTCGHHSKGKECVWFSQFKCTGAPCKLTD